MRIVTLMENSEGAPGCLFEHGLSCYIETKGHTLLFDSGASSGFLENARLLDIDLAKVDTVFLSHGHYDHAGGLLAFAAINHTAPIYMQRSAAGGYYRKDEGAEPHYIGIDPAIMELPQVKFLDGDASPFENAYLFSGITGRRFFSASNFPLKEINGLSVKEDSFAHEQCLVIREDGKYYLFSGCAHNGMLNILDRFREIFGCAPDFVISGFHFMKKSDYTAEEMRIIEETAKELAALPTVFYTGHCTSLPAYFLMKPFMGRKLQLLHSGTEVDLTC